jgi:DNA-directed RNA polymerase subunit RPC12/RpoP
MTEVVCGECKSRSSKTALACQSCGSATLYHVSGNAVVSVPAGTPCTGCGTTTERLVFRGWTRRTAWLIGSSEKREAGYVCRPCSERRTANALIWTGLLGWWSISSALFRTPIATVHNWISAFRPPPNPLAWGAVGADALFADAGGDVTRLFAVTDTSETPQAREAA